MKPSCSTLPSSSWLVAMVVPWHTAVTSAPTAPMRSSTLWTPLRKPSAGSAGVVGVLVVTRAPDASSKATTSVNVPPVSMPMRMRRRLRVMARLGDKPDGGAGSRPHDQVWERGGGRALEIVAVVADQVEVAVGQVVETLAHAGPGRQRAQRLLGVEARAHPAFVRGRPGGDVRDRRDDVRVAEVQHPGRVDAGGVGADDVDVVVVRPGPGGQLPEVGAAQQGRRAAENLRTPHRLDAGELGVVAVEADDHADAAQLRVDHRHLVAGGHPPAPRAALAAERVRLAVDPQQRAVGADEGTGVVDHAALGAPLVAAHADVDAEVGCRCLDRLDHATGQLGDQVPQLLRGAARSEAGGCRLGQDDQLGAGGLDAAGQPVDAPGDVGLDGVGAERPGDRGDLDGGGGEGPHGQRLPATTPTATPARAIAAPTRVPTRKSFVAADVPTAAAGRWTADAGPAPGFVTAAGGVAGAAPAGMPGAPGAPGAPVGAATGATATGARTPAMSASTAWKNWPAIFLATPVSIR